MESMFFVENPDDPSQRTFARDESLPPLPLPQLENTVAKYLDSCRPVLESEEYQKTSKIAQDFLKNDGKRLQIQLEKRSKERKNWLEAWWVDGYLTYRGPAAKLNFSGLTCYMNWPFKDQLKSLALQIYFFMEFWQILREEKLRPQADGKGNPFNMAQFRSVFNSCRIPDLPKDYVRCSFRTKYEGSCPSHVIIFHRKRIYKIQGVHPSTGDVLSPSHFHKSLLAIMKNREVDTGVAYLTELYRDDCANARTHLLKLSSRNERALSDIETAAFCAAITEDNVQDFNDLLHLGLFDTGGLRWMDKFNLVCGLNNEMIVNCDHTSVDGMVFVTMITYFNVRLKMLKSKGMQALWGDDSMLTMAPVELHFDIDDFIKKWICQGHDVAKEISDMTVARYFNFTKFGKSGIRRLGKIHPCAFLQVCLQYTYMKMTGKPASTYETATTRMFYKGRTETLRTCTSETVECCREMIAGGPDKKTLFLKACQKYYDMMEECKLAQGCDRHLFGLAMAAMENGEKLPEIFTDPAFAKSGGGGNFILSTSLSGYGTAAGIALPFREDGYGAFYRINNQSILFLITAYRTGPTDAREFEKQLEESMIECYTLLDKSAL